MVHSQILTWISTMFRIQFDISQSVVWGSLFPQQGITQLAPLCLGILAVKPAAENRPAECAQGPKLLIEIILSSSTLLHSGSPNHGWLLKLYRQTEWIEGFFKLNELKASHLKSLIKAPYRWLPCVFSKIRRGEERIHAFSEALGTPLLDVKYAEHSDSIWMTLFSSFVQRSDHYPAMHTIQSTSTPPKPFQHLTLRGTNWQATRNL